MGRSNNIAFNILARSSTARSSWPRADTWRSRFLGALPFLQIPDFKTPASAHERDLAFQAELPAMILGQNETTLFVGAAMLRASMEVAQHNAAIAPAEIERSFSTAALIRANSSGGMTRRNCPLRIGENDELLGLPATPAGGDREYDSSRRWNGGIRRRRRFGSENRCPCAVEDRAILIHSAPLLTTLRTKGQRN